MIGHIYVGRDRSIRKISPAEPGALFRFDVGRLCRARLAFLTLQTLAFSANSGLTSIIFSTGIEQL